MHAAAFCFGISAAMAQEEIPVNMYTGTPNISIPLWNATAHDIIQPVSLSYNANGIKVGESEGWFGVGWDLSASGSITREVRGLPDDLNGPVGTPRKGWLYQRSSGAGIAAEIAAFGATADLSSGTCSDEQADQTAIHGYHTERIDTEPDLFSYSFGGYSGSFVFDNSATPIIRFIPYRDFKISYTTVSGSDKTITGFTIRTNDGLIYTFGRSVSLTRKIMNAPQAVSFLWRDYDLYNGQTIVSNIEWKLTRIESPSGAYINFNYSPAPSVDSENEAVLGIYNASVSAVKTVPAYTVSTTTARYWLDYMETSVGHKVEFKKPGTTLDKVRILDTRRGAGNELVKEFVFNYVAVSHSYGATGRKFLYKVSETSGCDRMPPYQFSYAGVSFQNFSTINITSTGNDFWGYYNGKTRNSGFPKLYVYPGEPLAERFRTHPIPGYSGLQVVLDGDDQIPDGNFMKIGTLNRIDYPSGGSTVLQYEANEYFDARTGENHPAGGLRIKSITQYDGINTPARIAKTFEYTNPSNTQQSAGRLISRPDFVMPAWKYRDPTDMDNASTMKSYGTLSSSKTTEELWKMLLIRTADDLSEQTFTQGSPVGYEFVTVKRPGAGSARYEFMVPGKYGETSNGYWSATENKFARPSSCPGMGIVASGGRWAFPRAQNPEFDFERGIIFKKHEFDESGNPVRLVENEYQYLYKSGTQPVNVWGLHYERYPNSDDPIYFYGKYFLPTEYDRVLKKETVTTYDATTTAKNIVETTEYAYESSTHKLLTSVKRTSGDGTIYTTKMKYPLDFGAIPANAEDALLRIKDLQDPSLFRHNVVIEQQQRVQRPGGADQVTGATLSKFSDFGTSGKILFQQQLSLSLTSPVTDFSEVTTELKEGSYRLKPDMRYDTVTTILKYDAFDKPLSSVGPDRITSSTVWGFGQSIPVASVTNAKRGEFAFSDFETTTGDDFGLTNAFYAAPRSGTKGLHPYALIQKTVTKQSDNYHLTFWFRHSSAVTFRVTIKNIALTTTYYDQTIPVTPAASGFVYVDNIIPVTSAPASFVIQLAGQSLTAPSASSPTLTPSIDDVAFYPDHASLASFTYTFPFGVDLITSQGIAKRTVFDKLGRMVKTFDQNDNMLNRNTYTFGKPLFAVDADFSVLSTPYYGDPISFSAPENSCLTGVTYEWDFGDGIFTPGPAQITHTFTDVSKSTYNVRLRVSYSAGAPVIRTQQLVMQLKPISVNGCVNGTITYNTCGDQIERVTTCSQYPTPANGSVFYVSLNESIPNATFTWKKRWLTSTEWVTVATGTQYTLPYIKPNTGSYELKCEVRTPDGRFGEYFPPLDIVPCEIN
ncbi:hypothetical protein KK083_19085 [Fulvivirgaceae bacterium PWU4]|uniref:PKD domain-containing protein n=1 Tax=Chryseosolibacter histidini TaxID=2782349 RepID=A0AAP2GQY3_9BACT|nr:PKD domain-containing protein [Chryseosolibacter histidini]MBT1699007.1 hypothetical protein [Chryseosolibacter histidini]